MEAGEAPQVEREEVAVEAVDAGAPEGGGRALGQLGEEPPLPILAWLGQLGRRWRRRWRWRWQRWWRRSPRQPSSCPPSAPAPQVTARGQAALQREMARRPPASLASLRARSVRATTRARALRAPRRLRRQLSGRLNEDHDGAVSRSPAHEPLLPMHLDSETESPSCLAGRVAAGHEGEKIVPRAACVLCRKHTKCA